MRAARLQELEEMAARLLALARKLQPGQLSRDDGYSPPKSLELIRQLVEDDHCPFFFFALALGAAGLNPGLSEQKRDLAPVDEASISIRLFGWAAAAICSTGKVAGEAH